MHFRQGFLSGKFFHIITEIPFGLTKTARPVMPLISRMPGPTRGDGGPPPSRADGSHAPALDDATKAPAAKNL